VMIMENLTGKDLRKICEMNYKNNIYLIETTKESDGGYDSYDGHVVVAKTELDARVMCPTGDQHNDDFINPKYSTIKKVGVTNEEVGVLLSSFNAG
jgi:hypothetical protein